MSRLVITDQIVLNDDRADRYIDHGVKSNGLTVMNELSLHESLES